MSRLFTQDFIDLIERLRLRTRQVPAGGRHAEHRSFDPGSGMEFRDFRAYVPGDDLRRVDWNVFRRSGKLFLRLFEELEDLPVYILLDTSESMFFETPPRIDAARQMAALMAAVALNQFDRTAIYPFGADFIRPLATLSGKQSLHRVLSYLEQLRPAGGTDLVGSLRKFSHYKLRGGLAVVISDFFDPRGIDEVCQALKLLRHRLLLVQMVRAGDAQPEVGGDLRLIDCESGFDVDVSITPAVLERYHQAYQDFANKLLTLTAMKKASHLKLNADLPIGEQLNDLFVHGVLVT